MFNNHSLVPLDGAIQLSIQLLNVNTITNKHDNANARPIQTQMKVVS